MKAHLKQIQLDLTVGQTAGLDLFDGFGVLLLRKGEIITESIGERLKNREVFVWIEQTVHNYFTQEIKTFPKDHYTKFVGELWSIFHDAKLIEPEQIEKTVVLVEEIIKDLRQQRVHFDFSLSPLDYSRLKEHDYGTFVHSLNVALLAAITGMRLEFGDQRLKNLILGALLHDLGKLKIPKKILNKPGKLTAHEFAIIKRHPHFGAEMLKAALLPLSVVLTVKEHHERWNSRGYPHGVQGDGIYLDAQIVAVADVYEALTADRPYRKGIPPYQALEMIIAWSGKDFNPLVVDAFCNSLVLYPKNAIVTLNTGEVGRVVSTNKQFPTRPLIRLLIDNSGRYLNQEVYVDLMQNLTRFIERMEFEEEVC